MKAKHLFPSVLVTFLSVIFLLTATTCKKKSEDTNTPQEQEVIIPSTSKVINGNDFQSALISLDTNTSTLVLSKDILNKVSLNVGDVIISDIGDGYLQKIKSIVTTGNQLTIVTDSASITDAITKGEISFKDSLPPSLVLKTERLVDGIIDKTNYSKTSENPQYHLTLDFIVYDLDGNPNTTDNQIRFTGDFIMNPDIDFKARLNSGTLEYCKAEFKYDESFSLTAISTLLSQKQFDKVVWKYEFPIQIVWVGTVPVIYKPILEIHAGFMINCPFNISVGFTQGFHQTAGGESGQIDHLIPEQIDHL